MNRILQVSIPIKDSKFALDLDEITSFICNFSKGSKFAFLLNFGFAQLGKSLFSQLISGLKHEIGDEIQPKTEGIIISYCGTIQDLISKFKIDEDITVERNLHVFNIDTEGFMNHDNKLYFIHLFPIIQICSIAIVYGKSFTDTSIIPFIDGLYHLSNINIILTLKNSYEIIEKKNQSINFYLKKAELSSISKKLAQNKIKIEIIPCTDFREEVQNKFSKRMNKYLISRVLSLLTHRKWNNANEFFNAFQNFYSNQDKRIISTVFNQGNSSDSLIKLITDDCIQNINQKIENSDPNDILLYDRLLFDVKHQYDEMCYNFKIDKSNYDEGLVTIKNHIRIRKINAQLMINQNEEAKRIIEEERNKLEKEKEFVNFLSIKIYEIANTFILNMASFILNKDSSSLKSLDSYFLIRCDNTIATAIPYVRKEVIEHVEKDVNEISKTIHDNAIDAANTIEKDKKEKREKICVILLFIGSFVASAVPLLCGRPEISSLISSFFGISKIPFKMTDKPNENNFVIKIGNKKYEATYDEFQSFLEEIGSAFGDNARSISELLTQEIDASQIESYPISFDQRDYQDFYNNLINK